MGGRYRPSEGERIQAEYQGRYKRERGTWFGGWEYAARSIDPWSRYELARCSHPSPPPPSPARATVAALHDDGTVDVHYSDGDKEQRVPRRRIRVFVCADAADRAAGREANRQKTEAKRAAKAAEREAARATVVEAAAAVRGPGSREGSREGSGARRRIRGGSCRAHLQVAMVRAAHPPAGWAPRGRGRAGARQQGADGGKNWFAGVVTAVGGPPPARAEI